MERKLRAKKFGPRPGSLKKLQINSRANFENGKRLRWSDLIEAKDYYSKQPNRYLPKTRGECPEERPCPYVSCKHHLYLDLKANSGTSIIINFPDKDPDELHETCSLDLAERGSHLNIGDSNWTLDEVGKFINVTRERVRQIEESALRKLRESCPDIYELLSHYVELRDKKEARPVGLKRRG